MNRKSLLAAAAAAVLGVAACGDPTGFGADVGVVSLRYAGAESGALFARGARREEWATRTHAAGLRLDSPERVRVFAYSLGRRGVADQFFLHTSASGPGTYAFAEDRRAGTAYAQLALDVSVTQNSARAIYVLTSGSVVLEEARGRRIRGRFEGTARLLNGEAVVWITGGRFDVPDNLPRPVD